MSPISNSFKTAESTIPVNIYQFLHQLLRTSGLWRKNWQKSFRLFNHLKIHGYSANMFFQQTCQCVCSNAVKSDDMIFLILHISKITMPYIRALHTQGRLTEARSQIGKRFSEKISNFMSCCGTMYMSTHYGKLLLVTSLLFLSQPNQNSALPIIIAENQSHNLIIGKF